MVGEGGVSCSHETNGKDPIWMTILNGQEGCSYPPPLF